MTNPRPRRPIRLLGDPVLRRKAEPIEKVTRRVVELAKEMRETMYEANGVGLAAPQIGVSQRLIVVDVGDGPVTLINPRIERSEGVDRDLEGCLSIPGISGYVDRAHQVVVTGLDLKGRPQKVEAQGFFARALQHEIDHLEGVLFIDKATSLVREGAEGEPEPVTAEELLEQERKRSFVPPAGRNREAAQEAPVGEGSSR